MSVNPNDEHDPLDFHPYGGDDLTDYDDEERDYGVPEGDQDHDEEDRLAYEQERLDNHPFSKRSRKRELYPDELSDLDQNNPVDMDAADWRELYSDPDYEDFEP